MINNNPVLIKSEINAAINLSTAGKVEEAVNTLSSASLSADQKTTIEAILSKTTSKKPAQCMAERVQLFQLLTTPERIRPNLEKTDGFNRKAAIIHFIGPKFQDFTELPSQMSSKDSEQGIIQTKAVVVSCYSNNKILGERYNFREHGFQFFVLGDQLTQDAQRFASAPYDKKCRSELSISSIRTIESWGKKNNIPFDQVVPLGFIYRDEDTNDKKAQRPFSIAHVDIQQSSLRQTLLCLQNVWKPEIESVLGPLSIEQYTRLPITQVVNLWMPLNKRPTKNGLAIMNTSTLTPSKDLRPFLSPTPDGNGFFHSLSLHTHEKQSWVAQELMPIGNGLIFNSWETPHSAVTLPEDSSIEYDTFRKSVEGRFAFIKY